jgi:hypothetical protein
MNNSVPSEGPQIGSDVPVVTPEELTEWRAAVKKARQQCINLGLGAEFEAKFREYKRRLTPPEASLKALEDVALPKMLKDFAGRTK